MTHRCLSPAVVLPLLLLLALLPRALSLSPISISLSPLTICALPIPSSVSSPRNILCTRPFTSPLALSPTVSFSGLSGASGSATLCALRPDSLSFLCWPTSTLIPKRVYIGPTPLSDLSLGRTHIAALTPTSVRFWRVDASFPLAVNGTFRSLASGDSFTCAISNTTVNCWGSRRDPILLGFQNESMETLVAGDSHACGENTAGFLVCRGSNSSGQLGTEATAATAFEYSGLALGSAHTCAIRRVNRTVVCWGGDGTGGEYTPLGYMSVELLVAGGNLTCAVTTANFSVKCWFADPRNLQVTDAQLPKVLPGVCISDQSSCKCGIEPDSESMCWGSGIICNNVCPNPTDPSALAPQSLIHNSSTKTSKLSLVLGIAGGVGILIGACSLVYCLWKGFCRRKKVYNSVQPTITPPAGNVVAADRSNGVVRSPRMSPSGSKSRAFRRQSSRMKRQRSGPSSLKERAEQFSFADLAAATKNFAEENKIGAGSFGTVYKGKLKDGSEVAIKRGETGTVTKKLQENESAFQSELSFLSRLHHKHLVGFVGYCEEGDERLLVYEYMKNGALFDHLHSSYGEGTAMLNSWKMRIKVLLDAARGIEYLHTYAVPPIIHRDIKSSNILLDANWVARVSDFGLSLMGPEIDGQHLSMRAVGTVGYMDPEYFGLHHLTVKSDVYGLGVVMLEVLTGKRAIFKSEDSERGSPVSVVDYAMGSIVEGEIGRVLDARVGPPTSQEAEAVELVAYTAVHCVSLEGKERPTMSDVVSNLERALAMCEESDGSFSSASISLGSYG